MTGRTTHPHQAQTPAAWWVGLQFGCSGVGICCCSSNYRICRGGVSMCAAAGNWVVGWVGCSGAGICLAWFGCCSMSSAGGTATMYAAVGSLRSYSAGCMARWLLEDVIGPSLLMMCAAAGAVLPDANAFCAATCSLSLQPACREDTHEHSLTQCCVVLLQRTSCDSITPVTAPGTRFPCPSGYEYAPAGWPPSITTCCKVSAKQLLLCL